MTPTLHTLTTLLNPWRTIRRLEAENRRLEWQYSDFIDKVSQLLEWRNQKLKDELATNNNREPRLRHCPTHVQQPPNAWGCPECVSELRRDLGDAQGQLATAREALQRVACAGWFENSQFSVDHHARVVEGVADWVCSGMTGPLPPLPGYLAKPEKVDAGETP